MYVHVHTHIYSKLLIFPYQTCKVLPYLQSPQEPHRQDLTFSKPLRPSTHQNSDQLLHFPFTLLTILWYSDSESLSVSGKASPPILFLFHSCSFFSFSQFFLSLSIFSFTLSSSFSSTKLPFSCFSITFVIRFHFFFSDCKLFSQCSEVCLSFYTLTQ